MGLWALSCTAGGHAIWYKLSALEALKLCTTSDLAIPLLGRCRLTMRPAGTGVCHAHLLIPTAEHRGKCSTDNYGLISFGGFTPLRFCEIPLGLPTAGRVTHCRLGFLPWLVQGWPRDLKKAHQNFPWDLLMMQHFSGWILRSILLVIHCQYVAFIWYWLSELHLSERCICNLTFQIDIDSHNSKLESIGVSSEKSPILVF